MHMPDIGADDEKASQIEEEEKVNGRVVTWELFNFSWKKLIFFIWELVFISSSYKSIIKLLKVKW